MTYPPARVRRRRFLARVLPVVLGLLGLVAVGHPAQAGAPAQLALSSPAGSTGAVITASGSGFPKSSTGTVSVPGRTWSITTTSKGFLKVVIAIPAPTNGNKVVVLATVRGVSARAAFAVHRLRFGVATPGGATAFTEVNNVAAALAEQPGMVLSYGDFTLQLDVAGLKSVAARGAIPLVTWEPWSASGGTIQPAFALKNITGGTYDAYITQYANDLKAYGGTVWLRFAHEMNGNWYPWAESVIGNSPGDYVAAWRHVHDLFTAAGATNARWVWSPSAPYPGSTALSELYPGAGYVDVLGLDGYNWGTSQFWSTWQSPIQLFDGGLSQLRALAPGLPIVIAETASTEAGGSKADWNGALVPYLSGQAGVAGFVWFDIAKEASWPFDSSPTSLAALKAALAGRP